MSTALMTDAYELTMLDAWVRDGKQDEVAVFEVFTRRLTPHHQYGVVAGVHRVIEAVGKFQFDHHELVYLQQALKLSDETVSVLENYEFTGTINAYPEGELYFPNSPIVQIVGTLKDCILETLVLSILNHDCAIAGKASRMVCAAQGRPIIEMGSRRTHEAAAVDAARAAYLAGFNATSNLQAGIQYGVPVRGTAAHAFTLSYADEQDAFECQAQFRGTDQTFLVDTYDVAQGVRNAIAACAPDQPGGVRIDSGHLGENAQTARVLLDAAGCLDTKIVATSDLDEHAIHNLISAPVDAFGVGTQLVSTPPAGMVYKLVEINGRSVEKKSTSKMSKGGKKIAWRHFNATGQCVGETITTDSTSATAGAGRVDGAVRREQLMSVHVEDGKVMEWIDTPQQGLIRPDLMGAREYHKVAMRALPVQGRYGAQQQEDMMGPLITAVMA